MVLPIGAKERNQTKFDEKHLTTSRLYGLMRPVARIAQSVEQGIENPRVLGSIPSPGTTYSENPPKRRVFAFPGPDSPSNCVRLFAASGSPLRGQRARRAVQRLRRESESGHHLFREPAQKAGFCFSGARLSIELCSIIRRQRLTPSGPARQACRWWRCRISRRYRQ